MSNSFIICIIDDDDIYQFTATKIIESSKLAKKILIFSDGKYAINYLIDNIANSQNIPDIVFLDLNMPVMDGWQFLEEYVKLKPRAGKEITLYIISSSVDPADLKRAEKISEVSDYLVKPITKEMLLEIVATLQ